MHTSKLETVNENFIPLITASYNAQDVKQLKS